jgi:hypothetical protein
MASFEIKDCPTKLTITEAEKGGKKVQTGMLTLDVRNATDRRRTGRIRVEPGSGAKPEWFSIDGAPSTNPREIEQDFAAKGEQSVRVNLAVPAGEPAKSLIFNALATAEDDPDNDFVKSPNVAFDIAPWKEAKKIEPKHFPWWIVAVAAALVLVVGGGLGYILWPKPKALPDVAGLPAVEAKAKLEQAGIPAAGILVMTDMRTSGKDPNVVVHVDQNYGRVNLLIDPGVFVPLDQYQHFEGTAADFLKAGFVLAPNGVHSETNPPPGVPNGFVFRTNPPGGTHAKLGAPFELWVAAKPEIPCPPTALWCRKGVVIDQRLLIQNLQAGGQLPLAFIPPPYLPANAPR